MYFGKAIPGVLLPNIARIHLDKSEDGCQGNVNLDVVLRGVRNDSIQSVRNGFFKFVYCETNSQNPNIIDADFDLSLIHHDQTNFFMDYCSSIDFVF